MAWPCSATLTRYAAKTDPHRLHAVFPSLAAVPPLCRQMREAALHILHIASRFNTCMCTVCLRRNGQGVRQRLLGTAVCSGGRHRDQAPQRALICGIRIASRARKQPRSCQLATLSGVVSW